MTESASYNRLRVNGVELAWSERGTGPGATPALVLVHGFTGAAHDFTLHVGALAARRRVVTIDQRGHGRSTRTGALEDYSVDQLTSDLIAFVETVGGGPVDLLGHSMGGRVVMGLALRRPDLVHSLILMDTSAWSFMPDNDELVTLARAFMDDFDPARGMPRALSLGSPEDTLIAANVPAAWQQEKEVIFAGMDPYAVKALGTALMADVEVEDGRAPLRGELASIACPTTVIVGEHDHPLVDQAPELAASVADGRLTVVAGAYHSPQLTHPDDWRAAVEAHLAWVGPS
jgi:pimeloyl-ACP methyl ester carboxylesterase